MTKKAPNENIGFSIHPRVMKSLGADLVTGDDVAIIELIKNAYDAMATRVDVRFLRDERNREIIEIEDDGTGMTRDVLVDAWFTVGTPFREKNKVVTRGGSKRRASGEKGLGRLSSARLGQALELVSRVEKKECLQVNIDWAAICAAKELADYKVKIKLISDGCPIKKTGTLLRVSNLNSSWDEHKVDELIGQLSRFLSPFEKNVDFAIWVTHPGKKTIATKVEALDYLDKPIYKIRGKIDSLGTLMYQYDFAFAGKEKTEKAQEEIRVPISDNPHETIQRTPRCGGFSFEIRAWDTTTEALLDVNERFELGKKASQIRQEIKNRAGISLYRDRILVLPKSMAGRDWLNLDLRRVSRVGPRLSTSQLIGYVDISADKNPDLSDTSDRERLVSNDASRDFKRVIFEIVSILENRRERDKESAKQKEPPLKDLFGGLSPKPLMERVSAIAQQGGKAAEVLPAVEEYGQQVENAVEQIEERFYYYSRLASLGTIAAILAHEVRNRTTIIGELTKKLFSMIKSKGVSLNDISIELANADKALKTLEHLADTFAPLSRRTLGVGEKRAEIADALLDCLAMRDADIKRTKIKIKNEIAANTVVSVPGGEVEAVILNLLDNAIYWLQRKAADERQILFKAVKVEDEKRIRIEVHDSGPGVDIGDEAKIFWPGVTRKPEGLGMGLTVAAEIVSEYGGKLFLITPGHLGGASFCFDLPLLEGLKK